MFDAKQGDDVLHEFQSTVCRSMSLQCSLLCLFFISCDFWKMHTHTFAMHVYLTPNHPGNDPHPPLTLAQLQFKSTSQEVSLFHASSANACSSDSYSKLLKNVLCVKFRPPEGAESILDEHSACLELSVVSLLFVFSCLFSYISFCLDKSSSISFTLLARSSFNLHLCCDLFWFIRFPPWSESMHWIVQSSLEQRAPLADLLPEFVNDPNTASRSPPPPLCPHRQWPVTW